MSKHAWKVDLIPWDHLSPEHVERMYQQRVACGWRSDEIQQYVDSAKAGGKIFYWVVLSDALPERENLLETHMKAYPKESTPLLDTASEIRLVPRSPTRLPFTPVGHIALEIHPVEEDAKLGLFPDNNNNNSNDTTSPKPKPTPAPVWIHQLYISYALQRGGLGAGAMGRAEQVAASPPMNGNLLVLDTMTEVTQLSEAGKQVLFLDRGLPVPFMSTEAWYTKKLGYEEFRREEDAYRLPLAVMGGRKEGEGGAGKDDGEVAVFGIVYLKKEVVVP